MEQAVITLIEKKGKDRSLLENWRPISLVDAEAKIMSKVIASRIKNVSPNIIHHNQTGYVKDRFIGETIRSIFDIMDFSVSENIPSLLLFSDFQKALDSVEWNFLFESLKMFNFGENFLRWVKTLYNNIQSCVMNNGTFSNFFTLERGVRQGDPLSPYLFTIVVETLAIAIRQNEFIKYYFQNESECFIGVSKHRETNESTRPQAECFYCFEVFGYPDETRSTSFGNNFSRSLSNKS